MAKFQWPKCSNIKGKTQGRNPLLLIQWAQIPLEALRSLFSMLIEALASFLQYTLLQGFGLCFMEQIVISSEYQNRETVPGIRMLAPRQRKAFPEIFIWISRSSALFGLDVLTMEEKVVVIPEQPEIYGTCEREQMVMKDLTSYVVWKPGGHSSL